MDARLLGEVMRGAGIHMSLWKTVEDDTMGACRYIYPMSLPANPIGSAYLLATSTHNHPCHTDNYCIMVRPQVLRFQTQRCLH